LIWPEEDPFNTKHEHRNMPTLADVASLAGVSTATVSRTLNNPELVDPITREKVTYAIKTSGYTRNETARSLATRSSRTIGLLTDNFAASYFAPIMDETIGILQRHGYFTIVEATGNNTGNIDLESQRNAWHSLINRQVESIIMLCIHVDDAELATMLIEFPKTARIRGKGFSDELAANGVALPESRIFKGSYTIASGAEVMQKIIKEKDTITAVFAQNDDMAAGAINACHTAGIDVPKQISFIGFDNSTLAQVVFPRLSTISQPLKTMSQSAAELALQLSKQQIQTANPASPQTHFMPDLIERMSVVDRNELTN